MVLGKGKTYKRERTCSQCAVKSHTVKLHDFGKGLIVNSCPNCSTKEPFRPTTFGFRIEVDTWVAYDGNGSAPKKIKVKKDYLIVHIEAEKYSNAKELLERKLGHKSYSAEDKDGVD